MAHLVVRHGCSPWLKGSGDARTAPNQTNHRPAIRKINDCFQRVLPHTVGMERLFKIGLIVFIANELRGLGVVAFVLWSSRSPECQGMVKCLRMPYVAPVDPALVLQLFGITMAFGFATGLRGAVRARREMRATSPAASHTLPPVSQPNRLAIPSGRPGPS